MTPRKIKNHILQTWGPYFDACESDVPSYCLTSTYTWPLTDTLIVINPPFARLHKYVLRCNNLADMGYRVICTFPSNQRDIFSRTCMKNCVLNKTAIHLLGPIDMPKGKPMSIGLILWNIEPPTTLKFTPIT